LAGIVITTIVTNSDRWGRVEELQRVRRLRPRAGPGERDDVVEHPLDLGVDPRSVHWRHPGALDVHRVASLPRRDLGLVPVSQPDRALERVVPVVAVRLRLDQARSAPALARSTAVAVAASTVRGSWPSTLERRADAGGDPLLADARVDAAADLAGLDQLEGPFLEPADQPDRAVEILIRHAPPNSVAAAGPTRTVPDGANGH
jgi:hypothetical protein